MGLDMYLYKETYIGIAEYRAFGPYKDLDLKINVPGVNTDRVESIVEQVAYWRKANAIHKWFVDNVQDGIDNCQRSYVEEYQLQELLAIVNKVLKARKSGANPADGPLPTQSGCFFGPTEYDDFYWEDLKNTREMLTAVLAEDNRRASFYYRSSW